MDELYFGKEADCVIAEAYNDYLISSSGMEIYALEYTNGVYTEASLKEFGEKVAATIDKIIKAIGDFFASAISSISSAFTKSNAKEKLEELEKADLSKAEKVTIHSAEKEKEALNKYIQEMLKLERDVIVARGNIYATNSDGERALSMAELDKISKKIDELNASYDKEFLDVNKDTIQLAAKDAVRFSKKALDNVKVDFEEVEKNHKKILKEFKKNAEGVDVPVKHNLIMKIINSVATRMRKVESMVVSYRKKNLFATLAISAATAIGTKVVKDKLVAIGKKEMAKRNSKEKSS